jgi:uncharacterized protein YhaN
MKDPDHNPDGWTFATLYKHVSLLSDAAKEAVTAAIAAAQKAVDKAESAQQLRNEAQNEWRAAMKDQQATFADKEQTERRLKSIEEALATRAGAERGLGLVGSLIIGACVIISVIVAAAGLALRHS